MGQNVNIASWHGSASHTTNRIQALLHSSLYYGLFIQSQQQTLEACFYKYNICLDSNSHFPTFQLASILDQVLKGMHQLQINIEALILILVLVH